MENLEKMTNLEVVKPRMKQALFIVNKYAGTGYQPKLEGRIIDTCVKNDVECTIEFTRDRGHATELAREAVGKDYAFVVAVGGDGTLNEVAQGLINTPMPMGIIPRGSGNGLGRHLGISVKTATAIDQLFTSKVLGMDTFQVNGKLSLNVSGIGFDGHIANLFAARTRRGLAGYVSVTVKEFMNFKPFAVEMEMAGKTLNEEAFIIAFANSSQYGNNARVAPAASVRDGLLHINIMKKVPAYRADFVYAMFTGRLKTSAFCHILETPSVVVKTKHPVAYHVDGEPCGEHDHFDIRIMPGALQILVPERGFHTV